MYRRDYILRLIERFGQALLLLRNRILGRQVETADVLAQIHEIARQAGLDLGIARSLDRASMLMWLAPTGEIDPPRMWLLAELLYLEALQARSSGDVGAGRSDLERALAIYGQLPPEWTPSDEFVPASARVAEIQQLLSED